MEAYSLLPSGKATSSFYYCISDKDLIYDGTLPCSSAGIVDYSYIYGTLNEHGEMNTTFKAFQEMTFSTDVRYDKLTIFQWMTSKVCSAQGVDFRTQVLFRF